MTTQEETATEALTVITSHLAVTDPAELSRLIIEGLRIQGWVIRREDAAESVGRPVREMALDRMTIEGIVTP